ncbi:hypothetical protein SLEP1_g44953 [Rubroshorea leprosula]|uniref:Uncharacterized protein n=1 Tax=Rubroshorea leprosula TaxID=152421 RepID=A0AAV5LJZ4_9ROSI|nr:hypothetical protein SLEP1_g44953 [Rubroshorea leprosula]
MVQKSLIYAFVSRGEVGISIPLRSSSAEASGFQQQVHVQLRWRHLQLPRRQWLHILCGC